MSHLYPGWVDAYALAIKSGEIEKVVEITGDVPVRRWRVDPEKWKQSCARGGLKGGKAKKGWRKT